MKKGEKFSFAKVTCELAVCLFSTALPLNEPRIDQLQNKMKLRKRFGSFSIPSEHHQLGFASNYFISNVSLPEFLEIIG